MLCILSFGCSPRCQELFNRTVLENESLVIRNRELEREVMVWKQALAKADGDQETVQQNANVLGQQVRELQQQIRSLHVGPNLYLLPTN